MADEARQKRVLPARERRESAAKRRMSASSPPPPSKSPVSKKIATPSTEPPRQKRKYTKRASLIRPVTPSSVSTPPAADEFLPTRFVSSKPLPTTRQKQATVLSDKEYQSVADSTVLAASLHKSRMQWLYDGIFTKYWTKPVKRKGVTDVPANNPDPKSMQKLGNATITIEPHTFDVTFFTVRDSLTPVPYYRHPNQHTPKPPLPPANYGMYYPPPPHGMQPPPPVTGASPSAASPAPIPQPNTATPPVQVSSPPRSSPGQTSAPRIKQETAPIPNPNVVPPTPTANVTSVKPEPKPSTPALPPSSSAGSGPRATNDPVIQMLAARAASDSRLKELMKVVATSKASPEQLKEFQSHIDEFNAVVRRQEAERAGREREVPRLGTETSQTATQTPSRSASATAAAKPAPARPSPSPGAAHPSMYNPAAPKVAPPPNASIAGIPPSYMGYPPPPPRPEPIIKHIVMEFTTNVSSTQPASVDRWLFPEYTVLDIRYGGLEMICSFFVLRKGSEIIASMTGLSAEELAGLQNKWKANEEYYQPITMTIKANQHRTVETIARAAKSLIQVQDHMKEIMATKTRAPEEYLVHQLPREKGIASAEVPMTDFVDSAVEVDSGEEEIELLDWYGTL